MISKPGASECFVYIVPPGETSFVTAGRFALEMDHHGVARGRFVYGRSYLERQDAVPIDPIGLKLARRTYETTLLGGVFGALRDASPDYWGRRVIERYCGLPQLSEVDYLLYSPDDRAGALGFNAAANRQHRGTSSIQRWTSKNSRPSRTSSPPIRARLQRSQRRKCRI